MARLLEFDVAPAGSTGNGNFVLPRGLEDSEALVVDINVSAVGATPTATFKVQGSLDGTNWFDLACVSPTSDALVTSAVLTAVGRTRLYLASPSVRFARQYRVEVSANTNVTFGITGAAVDQD